MTFQHKDVNSCTDISVNEQTIQLFNELLVLCRQKECDFHFSYFESGEECEVTVAGAGGTTQHFRGSNLNELVGIVIEELKKQRRP